MPIAPSEIRYYKSTDSLGGPITNEQVSNGALHDLFDIVGGLGSLLGETNYRCIYIKNNNTLITLLNPIIYIVSNTPVNTSDISIGIGTSITGGIEQTIPNELQAPIGITFTNKVGENNGLDLGSIPKRSHKAIWIKRVIDPNASAFNNDNVVIRVRGETAA